MFFTMIFRELRRRYRQSLLTAVGLAVGVALVVCLTAYAAGVGAAQDEVLQTLYGVGTDITVQQTAKLDQARPPRFDMDPGSVERQGKKFSRDAVTSAPGQVAIGEDKLTELRSLRGVAQATGSLTLASVHVEGEYAKAAAQGGAGGIAFSNGSPGQAPPSQAPIKVTAYSVTGVDVGQTTLGPLASTELVSGRTFASSETDARVAVMDKSYARQNGYKLGSRIKISGGKYEVVGLVTSSAGASSGANVYIPLARAQTISDNQGRVNQIFVRAESADSISVVKGAVQRTLPKATVTTAQDLADQVSGSLRNASQLADTLGRWLAIVALAAAFSVAGLLTVAAVSRRTREIGTLKALGWRSRRVVGQVMGESLLLGVLGGILGVALGVLGSRLISWFSPALEATVAARVPTGGTGGFASPQGMVDALGMGAHTVAVQLTAPVSPELGLLAAGLAVFGGLLAGLLGGWRAARLRPADSLRHID